MFRLLLHRNRFGMGGTHPVFELILMNRANQPVAKKPKEEEEDPFGDEHRIDVQRGDKGWLEL